MSALRWVLHHGRSARGRLGLAVVLGAAASGAAVGLSATAAWLIARAAERPPVLHLMVAIVAVRTFGIARGLLRYGERLAGHDAAFRVLGELRVAAVERLAHIAPVRTRTGLASGELLARFVADVDHVQDLWVRVILPGVAALVVAGATVGLIAALVPLAGATLALSLVVAAVVAPAVTAHRRRRAAARLAPLRAAYQTELLELLDGATELAVNGALTSRLDDLAVVDATRRAEEARAAGASSAGAVIAAVAAGGATLAAVWFGTGAVESGRLVAVALAVVTLVPAAIHEVVGTAAIGAQDLPALAGSAARLREVMEQPAAVAEPELPGPLPPGPYGLRLTGVWARWDADSPDVLRGVELELPPGSSTVLTGVSGSGKSTLAAVLLRFLDPSAGSVVLVGDAATADVRTLAGDDVRSVVGWCAQDAHLFDSTIEANLRLARPSASDGALRLALELAGLADWVDGLPAGLGTMVGEHGRHLSGGQRQRLALARVLLADRPVVVFDEPTEHLDEATARSLAADLLEATRGRTVLVMTHRPELVGGADRLVELRDGRVVEGVRPRCTSERGELRQLVGGEVGARQLGVGADLLG